MDRHHDVLQNNKRISWLISGILGCAFFIFMGGYFLGKKKALEAVSSADNKELRWLLSK